MSLFATTKSLMTEYINKTNEIYDSTVDISNDVNNFTSGPTDTKLDAVKSSLDSVLTALNSLDTTACEDQTVSDISDMVSTINSIKTDNADAISDIATLKDGYNIVKTTVEALQPSMQDWISKSSIIFGETVKLLEKAKANGCK